MNIDFKLKVKEGIIIAVAVLLGSLGVKVATDHASARPASPPVACAVLRPHSHHASTYRT